MTKPPAWSHRDTALWLTCDIAAALNAGRSPAPTQPVAAVAPPQFAVDERYWAAGPFEVLAYAVAGDGSYQHNGGFFFATGGLGLALTAAAGIGRAVGNASRRRAAKSAAQPRWTSVDRGEIHVSSHAFYLRSTAGGLFPCSWWDVTSAEMIAPRQMHFQAVNNDPLILDSDWAELAFVTWALNRFPGHYQLATGTWLPAGWLQRAATHYPSQLQRPELGPGH